MNGASWLYFYTSNAALIRGGLPEGTACAIMTLEGLFEIAQQPGFGGFIVDPIAHGGCLTLVPANYYGEVTKALAE